MIVFRGSVKIDCRPEAVFDFLANLHRMQQAEGSPVLAIELTTPGPPRLGSRFRESVRMFPFYTGVILSEVTMFEPRRLLEETWTGPGMKGRDRYELTEIGQGTELVHQKLTSFQGLLRVVEPFARRSLILRLEARLIDLKHYLEQGTGVADAERQPAQA